MLLTALGGPRHDSKVSHLIGAFPTDRLVGIEGGNHLV